jgi:SAM-dependent methyltransferase
MTTERTGDFILPPSNNVRGRVRLGSAEAAVFETFVVPRYLSLFGELAIEMVAEGRDAQVVHLHCRTGYPDRGLLTRLPGAHFYGCDLSPSAIELARAKASTTPGMVANYAVFDGFPCPLPDRAFSHGITLHPLANPADRTALLHEMARLVAPRGQALIAMPIRGSFVELADIFREYALKMEDDELAKKLDQCVQVRPTVEMLGAELEEAGFHYVDVQTRTHVLKFQNGRDFFEDPAVRLLILPEVRLNLDVSDPDRALPYLREAIDKYWSEGSFELTVHVACASGRRV